MKQFQVPGQGVLSHGRSCVPVTEWESLYRPFFFSCSGRDEGAKTVINEDHHSNGIHNFSCIFVCVCECVSPDRNLGLDCLDRSASAHHK